MRLGLSYKSLFILITMSFLSTFFEVFGISMFLPIFQFIRFNGDLELLVEDAEIWIYMINIFDYINIEPSLIILLISSFVLFVLRQFVTYLRIVYSSSVTQKIIQKQRNNMFSSYIKADSNFHDKLPVGNLVNIITTEVNSAVNGIMAPIELIVFSIMLFGYVFILLFISLEMTIASIVVLIIASRIPGAWIKMSRNIGRKLVHANTSTSEFLVSRLRSPRLVRLSGTESAEQEEYLKLTQSQRKLSVYSSILRAKTEVVMEPVVIAISLTFLYFSSSVLKLQIEIIGIYLVVALRLMPVVKGIVLQWQSVQRFMGSIEIIERRIDDMESSIEVDSGELELKNIKSNIKFNKVCYRYPTSIHDVIHNCSIRIGVGEITAIVGPSGSGKSTLVDLLPRIRIPTSGEICIDNKSLDAYTLSSVRKLISYVPQTPQIFIGTIKNHILYGKPNATSEEIKNAAQMAGIDLFVNSLPDGYDTIIGEDASRLSGGQRQRLDLARALIAESHVLILDEPTSNLDAKSEEIFRQSVMKIRKETNKTIIIITHHLVSISYADKIIVLNNGKIESSGTHEELIEGNSWYSSAYKIQENEAY